MAVLNPQDRQRLLDLLSSIPALQAYESRTAWLDYALPDTVRKRIPRRRTLAADLAAIVDTCARADPLPDGTQPLLSLISAVLSELAGSPPSDQLGAIYNKIHTAFPGHPGGGYHLANALPDSEAAGGEGESFAVRGMHFDNPPVLPLTGGDDPAQTPETLPEDRGLESAARGQRAEPPGEEPPPAQKEVYALARWPEVEASTLAVGATYVLEAGVSPVPYSGGPHETAASMPFKVDVPAGGEPIEFFIMVRPGSPALAVIGPWQQTLQFQIQQAAPQVVQFHIRAVTAGPAQIAVDFYHEKHWLQTVTFQLTLRRALSLQ